MRFVKALTFASLLACPALAQTFSDNNFASPWTSQFAVPPAPPTATFNVGLNLTVSAPPVYREVQHIGYTSITLAHINSAATWNPVTQGSITSVAYQFTIRHITESTPASGAVWYRILLSQGSALYVGAQHLTTGTWATHAPQPLTAQTFTRVSATGPATPDFSCSGAPIRFGYLTNNGVVQPGVLSTTRSGIRDWRVTVNSTPCCIALSDRTPTCTPTPGTFQYSVSVQNTSSQTTQHVLISPPAGAAYSVSPNVVSTTLAPNGQTVITVAITGATAGQNICLDIGLEDQSMERCCSRRICFNLPPDCPCLTFVPAASNCTRTATGANITLTLQNLMLNATQSAWLIPLTPSTITVAPQYLPFVTTPNGMGSVNIAATGPVGPTICFTMKVTGPSLTECCALQDFCVTCPP